MLITAVDMTHIPQWIALARDVESTFKNLITDIGNWYDGFDEYMTDKIRQHGAFMAVRRFTGECLGIIAFSRNNNRITFLAVSRKYRRQGIGAALLRCALRQLDTSKTITATTFRPGYMPGEPSRRLYQAFGFVGHHTPVTEHGLPMCMMQKPPDFNAARGGSFHYRYADYITWAQRDHCPVCCHAPGPPDIVGIAELEHSWVEASMQAQGTLEARLAAYMA